FNGRAVLMTATSWTRRLKSAHRKSRFQPRVEILEDRTLLATTILNGTPAGQGYAGDPAGGDPPDTCGAAGPSSYIESTNNNIRIYTPKATGTAVTPKSADTFFFGTGAGDGGLKQITPTSQRIADVTMVYDDLMGGTGRFIIGDIDVDG